MRVQLVDVVTRFKATEALAGVSLTIEEGEFFTLLGPSGCGKTTTLRVIAGFYDPDAGTVRFGDTVVSGVPPAERGIGIVFQNYVLWPHMAVFENVAYGLRIQRRPPDEIRTRVAAAPGFVLIVLCAVTLGIIHRLAGARMGGLFGSGGG
ncbi:MAG: ABC transporter ATP-binding protein [Armatimonadetes bacterium]|nr:ABC transporter ATP-binding protein [Armatimonadota bacterium]